MAHAHTDPPAHGHDTYVEGGGPGAGMFVGLALILAILIIGLAVLWASPWDDDDGGNTVPNVPDVTDNTAPDVPVPDGSGGDDGGTGGEGAEPAP